MQFNVYINNNPESADEFPFLLDIQNDTLKHLATRLIVPLSSRSKINRPLSTVQPIVKVENEMMVALFDETTSYPKDMLGQPVANLSEYRDIFIQACDFLIQGY